MRYVEAFSRYGAKLKNQNWSVCAQNNAGELVVSLWQHHFNKAENGKITCTDRASRWDGPGNTEFRGRIETAYENKQIVRCVIARTDNTAAVQRGDDASKSRNTFSVKEDWLGSITLWDGNNYEITFEMRG